MVNEIPPDHVDDVPIVEPNQHDDVHVVPEPVLEDEDEDPEEEEFKEEEEPQEEDDIEVGIEEDENELDDGLFPGLMRRDINSLFGRMASLSRRLCGREMAHALVEKKGKEKDEYYGKLILDLGNKVRSSVEQGTAAMEKLVERLGNAEEKVECKKLKKELEEARFSNTFLRIQNERLERDLYWTRVRTHEFYQEMIRRGFVGTKVNTARPKAVLSAVKGNKGNAVKASACWVWRPKHKVLDHVSRNNGASMSFKRFDYIDAQGRSKSYLTDYEEIDGGFVAFGGNSKGGKITGKDFKLTDESHVLLKVPRKDNMYSVDLKNVVPQGGITCLFAKATSDEYTLWHRRLGHVNFKTMNKLVRENLVRGLPSKLFEINQTYVACQKEKQHRAYYHLGKFDGKADEGFFVGYFTNSKAFRVFNSRTKIVEENLHVQFSENTPNIAGSGLNWLFDIDALTNSMNYKPVVARNQSNGNTSTEACNDASKARMDTLPGKDYILLPLWVVDPPFSFSSKDSPDAGFKPSGEEEKKDAEDPGNEGGNPREKDERVDQENDANVNNTNNINTVSPTVNASGIEDNADDENIVYGCDDDPNMPDLEEIDIFSDAEDYDSEADINNLDTYFQISPVPTTRIHKDHPLH
ncbi:ribonuclease H-like domain-containing protein [Tanacetum coccineum]